jgi:hypothetical protein
MLNRQLYTYFLVVCAANFSSHSIEYVGSDLYSAGDEFESWSGHRLCQLKVFVVFLSPHTNSGIVGYLKLGHD